MSQAEAGKGSTPRPKSVSEQEYADRWNAIFGRDKAERIINDAKQYLVEHKRTKESIDRLEKSLKEKKDD